MKYAEVADTITPTALALSSLPFSTVTSIRLTTAKLTTMLTTPMMPNLAASPVIPRNRSGTIWLRLTGPLYVASEAVADRTSFNSANPQQITCVRHATATHRVDQDAALIKMQR